MKTSRAGILAGCLLGVLCLNARGEETPRDLCAFVDIGKAAGQGKVGQRDKPDPAIGADIRSIKGVTFDLRAGGLSLRTGEKVVFNTKDFVYAGEKGIESMAHRDMGPLALYSIQSVFLLHGVTGDTKEHRIGRVEFEYENGMTNSEDLILGENIGSQQVAAQWATMAANGYCLTSMLNPIPYEDMPYNPGKGHGLKSLTIVITNRDVVYHIAAMTCQLGRQKLHE